MAEAGLINAVQLDIKDDDGEIGYPSKVPLANRANAVRTYYDAREATDELHRLGVRVIGRIVNFFDPVLAKWAWNNGRPEMIVLDGSGGAPLANDYGTAVFTNFANPQIRKYQIDLAREAVRLGFDEILYDYVRRPEGDIETMTFPGLDMPPDASIARFVDDTKSALARTDALLGVSVFGVSAAEPESTGQDVSLLAPLVDYISPMVYPSLWGAGRIRRREPGATAGGDRRRLAHRVRTARGWIGCRGPSLVAGLLVPGHRVRTERGQGADRRRVCHGVRRVLSLERPVPLPRRGARPALSIRLVESQSTLC